VCSTVEQGEARELACQYLSRGQSALDQQAHYEDHGQNATVCMIHWQTRYRQCFPAPHCDGPKFRSLSLRFCTLEHAILYRKAETCYLRSQADWLPPCHGLWWREHVRALVAVVGSMCLSFVSALLLLSWCTDL